MGHLIDEQVSAYVDNELIPSDRLMVERHLESCEHCSQLVRDLLNMQSEILASFGKLSPPDDLENRVWEKINFKRAVKIGFVAFLTVSIFLFLMFLSIGSVVLTLCSTLYKVVFELIYVIPHFIALDPTMMAGFIFFAIILLVVSVLSLFRIIRASTSEGDESFG